MLFALIFNYVFFLNIVKRTMKIVYTLQTALAIHVNYRNEVKIRKKNSVIELVNMVINIAHSM
jgi:hypothetical protein